MRLFQVLIFFLLFTVSARSFGQASPDSLRKSQIKKTFSISPGINYHLQISHIDFAPVLVFKNDTRFEPGCGLNYLYYYRNSIRKGKSSYGFNLFTRYYLFPHIFLHGEYLLSDVAYLNQLVYEYHRVRKADFFAGAGLKQPVTDKTDAYLTILVNVNHSPESAYKNLILFRAGITF